MPGRAVAIAALSVLSVVSSAAGRGTPPRLYTLAATEACLSRLPHAVVGLPPANPPVPPAVFVDRLSPRGIVVVRGQVGVWDARGGAYEGIELSFFKSAAGARGSRKSLVSLYGGKVVRNVVVVWDQSPAPGLNLRKAVLGCLRATPPVGGTPATARAAPAAGLATFAGHWGGHTRGLAITPSGRGLESASDGCCDRAYALTFQILSVRGTLTRAAATYRVTSFERYHQDVPSVRTGRIGQLLLRNGIVTNRLTQDSFCSGPAWGATGACGA